MLTTASSAELRSKSYPVESGALAAGDGQNKLLKPGSYTKNSPSFLVLSKAARESGLQPKAVYRWVRDRRGLHTNSRQSLLYVHSPASLPFMIHKKAYRLVVRRCSQLEVVCPARPCFNCRTASCIPGT